MEEGNKKMMVQGIVFVIVFIIAFFGTKYIISSFKPADKELKKEVQSSKK